MSAGEFLSAFGVCEPHIRNMIQSYYQDYIDYIGRGRRFAGWPAMGGRSPQSAQGITRNVCLDDVTVVLERRRR